MGGVEGGFFRASAGVAHRARTPRWRCRLCFARKVGHFANKIGRFAFQRPKLGQKGEGNVFHEGETDVEKRTLGPSASSSTCLSWLKKLALPQRLAIIVTQVGRQEQADVFFDPKNV
jgi:hypothetical protein